VTTVSDPPTSARRNLSGSTWSSGPCAALEHRFTVTLPREGEFVGVLGAVVRPFATPSADLPPSAGHYLIKRSSEGPLPYDLFYNGQRLTSGVRAPDFCTMLSWHINRSVIDGSRDRHVLMHAACVTAAGVTVILPADQESGKTTTTAGLLRQGYDYVTDEAVALDPRTGRVTPFPKTLSLDPGSWHLFPELRTTYADPRARQWYVPAGHLGSRQSTGPVDVPRVIVFPRYRAGSLTAIEPVSRAEAVRQLALMTFEFQQHAGRNLRLLGRIAAGATVVRLVIGSLDDAVDAIDSLVSNALLEEI
jgi:hypothetical protein